MDIIENVLGMVAKHFKLTAFIPRWQAIKNLGRGKEIQLPDELAAYNLDMLSRSYFNISAIQPNSDWVWPYWVEKQYNPNDKSFLPSSYLSINLTHRNWTGFSSPNSNHESVVDPRGLVTPFFDGWSLDFWIKRDNEMICPSRLPEIDQHLVNKNPVIKSTIYKKNVKIISEVLMHEEDGRRFLVASYHVEPWEKSKVPVSFYLAIRPYNPESVVPVFKIEHLATDNAFRVNGKEMVHMDLRPDRVVCSNQDKGDSFFMIEKPEAGSISSIEDKSGLGNAFAEFKTVVDAVNSFSLIVIVPLDDPCTPVPMSLNRKKFSQIRSENIGLWNKKKEGSLKIVTPDSNINEAFEASKNNLLILVDKEEVTPGPFTYHKMWFRDAAYTVTALLKLGFTEDVKRIIEFYFKKQNPDGYFESQNGEWDSNGEVLWTICQYYLFTRDQAFIEKHFTSLLKAADWIFKNRKKTSQDGDDLHYGLLPAGYSAEHFGPSNYYYWDNFWGYAGVRDLILVGKILKKETGSLEKENEVYLDDIERSIRRVQDILGEKYIPSSPYRRNDSSMIGTVSAVYPLQIIDPEREDLHNTLRLIRKRFMDSGAFFHKLLHSGYNVYLTAQMAHCYVQQRSTLAIPILNWILDHATDTWTFPEAIHPETGGGCMGDGHHGWATSELIHLIRNILFYEEKGTLVFFPVMPQHWLDEGNKIEIENARSHFGKFNATLTSESDFFLFKLDAEFDLKPQKLEINMPVKIEKISINGKERDIKDRKFEIAFEKNMEIKIFT